MSWMVWSDPWGDNLNVYGVFDREEDAWQYRSECYGLLKPDVTELDDDEVEYYRSLI